MSQPQRPNQIILKACQTDDISLISQVLPPSSQPTSETSSNLFSLAIRTAIRRSAPKVLTHILAHGGSPPGYSTLNLENPSKKILEILIAHGWNINARRAGQQPFLWEVLGDGELVAWSLDHGATAIPQELNLPSDEERRSDRSGCPPILEAAASQSSVATFELLRSRGGELGRRTLHFAARAAINSRSNDNNDDAGKQTETTDKELARSHSERIAMVIHLVDMLKLDPNALDQPTGWSLGNHWGTPLCYVAHSNPNWDCRDVVTCLLQRGADPRLAVEPAGWDAVALAKRSRNDGFVSLVEEWEAQRAEKNYQE